MKRRVIRQGNGSSTIVLPAEWVHSQKIIAGEEIFVQVQGNTLTLSRTDVPVLLKKKQVVIRSEKEPIIRTHLNNLYRAGFDVLNVSCPSKKSVEIVHQVIETCCLGWEVTSVSDKEVRIERVSEPSEEKSEILFRKMFFLIKESFQLLSETRSQAKNILETEKVCKQVHENMQKLDQYDNFCRRCFIARSSPKSFLYWNASNHLKNIGHSLDCYTTIISDLASNEKETVVDLLERIQNSFIHLEEAFFKRDLHAVEKMSELLRSTIADQIKIIGKEQNFISLYAAWEAQRYCFFLSSCMLGILLSDGTS